jgi:hypothetical protein
VAALAVTRTRAEAFAAAAKDLASTHATEPAAAQLARAWNHELLRAREAESTAQSRKTEYYAPAKAVEDGAGGERSAVKKAARVERAAALAAKAAAEHTAATATAAAAAAAALAVAVDSGDVGSDTESIGADSITSDAPAERLTAAQRAAVRAAKIASKRHASTGAADTAATAAATELVAVQATAASAEAAAAAAKVAAATAAAALQARLLPPLPVALRSIYMHIEGVTGLPKALLATGGVTLKLTWCGRGMGSTVASATVSESGAAQWTVAQSFLLCLPAEPVRSSVNNSSAASSEAGAVTQQQQQQQQQRPQMKIEVWQGRYCHGTLDLEGDDLLRQCQRIRNSTHTAATPTNNNSGDACSSIAKWPHYYPHSVSPAAAASPPVSHAITAVAGSIASGGRLLLRAYVLEPGTDTALQAAQEVATAAASRWHGVVHSNSDSTASRDSSSVREHKVTALAAAMTRRWQCPLLYRLQALELVLSDACTATAGQRSVIIVVKRVCRTAASSASAIEAAQSSSSMQQQVKESSALATSTANIESVVDTTLAAHGSSDALPQASQSSEHLSLVQAAVAPTAAAATTAVTTAAVATATVTEHTDEVGRSQPLKLVPLLSCYTQSFALPAAALLEQLVEGCSEDNAATAGGAVIEVHVCQPKRFAAFTAAVAASTKPTASESVDLHSSDNNSSSSDSYSSTELIASVRLSAQQLCDCLGHAATVTLTPAIMKAAVLKAAVTAPGDAPTTVSVSTIALVGHVVCAPPPRPRLLLELSQFSEHATLAADTDTSASSVSVSERCTRLTVNWGGAEQSNLLHSTSNNKR